MDHEELSFGCKSCLTIAIPTSIAVLSDSNGFNLAVARDSTDGNMGTPLHEIAERANPTVSGSLSQLPSGQPSRDVNSLTYARALDKSRRHLGTIELIDDKTFDNTAGTRQNVS